MYFACRYITDANRKFYVFRQLPHSILGEDANVCLVVRDVKRNGRNIDYESTITHYETLFRNKKVNAANITIIPWSQLLNDYATSDQRRKLTFLYDHFLVDKTIALKLNAFLGSKLMQEARAAFPVDLKSTTLAKEIDANLRKVFYRYPFSEFAHKTTVRVGRHKMANEQIVDNIIDVIRQLGTYHPGGSQNIFKIHIKPTGFVANAVQLYQSSGKKICFSAIVYPNFSMCFS